MNWLIKRLFAASLIAGALTSCEDPTDIGAGLDTPLHTEFTDTVTVRAATVLLNDSISSFRSLVQLTGRIDDPALGLIEASSFTEVLLPNATVSFRGVTAADSMVLLLDYDYAYGDTTQDFTLNVHRLTEKFEEKKSYYTSTKLAYESAPAGTATFKPNPKGVYKAKPEDTQTLPVLARVKLDQALANSLMEQFNRSQIADQAALVNFLPGFALVPGPATNSMLGFNLSSANSRLVVYYTAGGTQYNQSFLLNGNRSNYISSDRNGTLLSALQQSGNTIAASQTNNLAFVQAGSGLRAKLSVPYLKNLNNILGGIALNRVELLVPVEPNTTTLFSAPSFLYLYETDDSNRILETSDGVAKTVQRDGTPPTFYSINNSALAIFDNDRNYYKVNITSYVQQILSGQKQNTGILLSPSSVAVSANRAILSNSPANPIKLRIYYTKYKN